jgi:hypothetical protein
MFITVVIDNGVGTVSTISACQRLKKSSSKNGNLGVTCTRLNTVGRRSPRLLRLSPASYKDDGGGGGKTEKAARHPCAIPNRFPPKLDIYWQTLILATAFTHPPTLLIDAGPHYA